MSTPRKVFWVRKRSSTGAELDLSSTGVPLNEDLERFARNREDPHLEAWRRFNKTIGSDGSVGIWHETYQVEPGKYEAIYNNMPVFGLAAATNHVPITERRETARRRLTSETTPIAK